MDFVLYIHLDRHKFPAILSGEDYYPPRARRMGAQMGIDAANLLSKRLAALWIDFIFRELRPGPQPSQIAGFWVSVNWLGQVCVQINCCNRSPQPRKRFNQARFKHG